MEKTSANPSFSSACARRMRAIDDTLDILSGKWKLAIIARLCHQPMRYSALLRDVTGISGKVLSRELQDLETNGLIVRHVALSKPLTVTYSISDTGRSLTALTDSLADWGLAHRARMMQATE
ncbi:winged helix-turn-helix transcriptional regulator [Hymenobacter pini]|uniref:winged helix-turn-helix transcriptional regulator n=1 Tax=Hymenobacter pini TaxID=2880879 RepID=UPI001CF3B003|nr:helix-turn-helix domain-containing protein [Hymenobacter pini]MCA8830825.1 helix-turn-helix transcriptional regulator [Hymenobacter pini]